MSITTAPQSSLQKRLTDMYARHLDNRAGRVATYIPELAKANPDAFGIAVATVDGKLYEVGDSRESFTIQSISKPFVYGLALADCGRKAVLQQVGVEPSGDAFNSIIFDDRNNRPFNPMVNAGAIATTAMIAGDSHERRLKRVLDMFERFTGQPMTIDEEVYRSEKETGHRNRAITYLELNAGMIQEPVLEHLDLYFQQCSILVDAAQLSIMAATLANNGINPVTGKQALAPEQVRAMLSVMASCGMYDFSGEWIYRIGLPAKSGVAGGILAVLPGQFGIGVFSPPLDERGNSVRGIAVCEDVSTHFNLHLFDKHIPASVTLRRSYRGDEVGSKRLRRPQEREILSRVGRAIQVHELQGGLFFASMERIARQIDLDLTDVAYLILDGRRVTGTDFSARSLMADERNTLAMQGVRLILAGFPHSLQQELTSGEDSPWLEDEFFATVDEALERCEDLLLAEGVNAIEGEADVLPLEEMEITKGLDDAELAVLNELVIRKEYEHGQTIIHEGSHADELYMLAAGRATIGVRIANNRPRKRLGALSVGVTFGELALFDGGPRTADITADTACTCYVLPVDRLRKNAAEHGTLQVKLLRNVGRALAHRLRQANAEIRALE